ncbi:MAG: VWA domain-containing protein [Candidatus Heimdallarchaeaceae archaeon]
MSSIDLSLTLEEIGDVVKVSNNNLSKLGAIDGDFLFIEDKITTEKLAAIVVSDSSLDDNTVILDKILAESKGFSNGITVTIFKFTGTLKAITKLTVAVEPKDSIINVDKLILDIRENLGKLKRFLDGRLIQKEAVFFWNEYNANIFVVKTEPDLDENSLAKLDWEGALRELSITRKDKGIPFNGILIIDVSGSMSISDMTLNNITVVHGLKAHVSGSIESYFNQFAEGAKIARYKAATLAALIYVTEKLGRGFGEKVGFIQFGSDAKALSPCGLPWYEGATCKIEQLMEDIISNVGKGAGGGTNMTKALDTGLELAKKFGDPKTKPIMFVLLTDGYPNDTSSVLEKAKTIANDYKNIILYTVGIGGSVNNELMEDIAAVTGGQYFKVTNMKDLLKWYSTLAHDISKRIKLK